MGKPYAYKFSGASIVNKNIIVYSPYLLQAKSTINTQRDNQNDKLFSKIFACYFSIIFKLKPHAINGR